MASTPTVDIAQCPNLEPGGPLSRLGWLSGIYCRLPGGRVRVPERDERQRFCMPGRYTACPVHHRHGPHQ